VSAGQVWRRADGLRWVEVQARTAEPSGWRLMVPLVDLTDAPDAPPLVVTLGELRARVHLVCGVPHDELGEADERLTDEHLAALRAAVRQLVDDL
jgi:hypothetical protein